MGSIVILLIAFLHFSLLQANSTVTITNPAAVQSDVIFLPNPGTEENETLDTDICDELQPYYSFEASFTATQHNNILKNISRIDELTLCESAAEKDPCSPLKTSGKILHKEEFQSLSPSTDTPQVDVITIPKNADQKPAGTQDLASTSSHSTNKGHVAKNVECSDELHKSVDPCIKENGSQTTASRSPIVSKNTLVDIEAQISSKQPSRGNVLSRWNFSNSLDTEMVRPAQNERSTSSTNTSSKVRDTGVVQPRRGLVADITRKWNTPNTDDIKPNKLNPSAKAMSGLDTSPSKQVIPINELPSAGSLQSSSKKQPIFGLSSSTQSDSSHEENTQSNIPNPKANTLITAKQSSLSSGQGRTVTSDITDLSLQTVADEGNITINTLSDGIVMSMQVDEDNMFSYPEAVEYPRGDKSVTHFPASTMPVTSNTSSQSISKLSQQGNKPFYQGRKPSIHGDKPSQQGDEPSQQGDEPSQQSNKPSQQSNKPSQQVHKPQQGNKPSQQGNQPPQEVNKPSQQGERHLIITNEQNKLAQNPFVNRTDALFNRPSRTESQFTPDDSNEGITMQFSIPTLEDEDLNKTLQRQSEKKSQQGNKPPALQGIRQSQLGRKPSLQDTKPSLEDIKQSQQAVQGEKHLPLANKKNNLLPVGKNLFGKRAEVNDSRGTESQPTPDDFNEGITMQFSIPTLENEDPFSVSDMNTTAFPAGLEGMSDSTEGTATTPPPLVSSFAFPEDDPSAPTDDEDIVAELTDDDSEDDSEAHHFSPRAGFIGNISHKWLFPTSFSGTDPFKAFNAAANALRSVGKPDSD